MDRKVRVDSGTYSDCNGSHVIDNVDGSDLQSTRTEVGLCATVRDSDNGETCTVCQFLRFFYNEEPNHDSSHDNPRAVVNISSDTTSGGNRDRNRDERKRIPSSTTTLHITSNNDDNEHVVIGTGSGSGRSQGEY